MMMMMMMMMTTTTTTGQRSVDEVDLLPCRRHSNPSLPTAAGYRWLQSRAGHPHGFVGGPCHFFAIFSLVIVYLLYSVVAEPPKKLGRGKERRGGGEKERTRNAPGKNSFLRASAKNAKHLQVNGAKGFLSTQCCARLFSKHSPPVRVPLPVMKTREEAVMCTSEW